VGTLTDRRRVTVLGSTGSIGVSTLSLFEEAGAQGSAEVEIVALCGGRNVELLAQQAERWRPERVVIADESLYEPLKTRLNGAGIPIAAGAQAVREAAEMPADWVMSAIVGSAGLAPTLAAARTGAVIALANKESLVCAGPTLLETAKAAGGRVIPVDSEHSAIFQSLQADPDRLGRAVPRMDSAGYGRRHAGTGRGPSQLEHGRQDFDRFGHHDEQGPGDDRGRLSVRHAFGTHRRLDPSPVHHPQHGRV
jgi:hypothetical protein